jgi:hypothetical protein
MVLDRREDAVFGTSNVVVLGTFFADLGWWKITRYYRCLNCQESPMEPSFQIGDRISDKSASPDESAVHQWLGSKAFAHWEALRKWIDANYPGVFSPEWLYGGKKRGWSLRYKKTKAFCTLLPEYKQLSVLVVFGAAERAKFEERRYTWRDTLVEQYDAAPSYPDGKWLTMTLSSVADRRDVMELLAMKRPPN